MKFIKTCISVVWALQQCPSRFYEGLKNAHRPFMSLSKIHRTIYEIHKNMHFLCRTAWACSACLMGARRARKVTDVLPPGEPVVFFIGSSDAINVPYYVHVCTHAFEMPHRLLLPVRFFPPLPHHRGNGRFGNRFLYLNKWHALI